MRFNDTMVAAAKAAESAVQLVMADYAAGRVTDEDDITPAVVGSLRHAFSRPIQGLHWSASVARHRSGVAAEEARIGADLVIHVRLDTPTQTYSKGVLVQAKRFEPAERMGSREQTALGQQCRRMLAVTPAAFVFNYGTGGMRCGSATRVAGAASRDLHGLCGWTAYRFFLELFRCPIGDPRLTSALVSDLPVPQILKLNATGRFVEEE